MKSPAVLSSLLLLSVGFLIPIGANPAANSFADETPLEIKASKDGFNLTCNVTNRSAKDIVAYTIVADLFDTAGKPEGRLSTNAIMNLSKGSTGGLAPGASGAASRGFALPAQPNGIPVDFKVFVDYVLFRDGSTWGPDVTKQSLVIMGTQNGWRQSRAHLKHLMTERGIQAVANELAE